MDDPAKTEAGICGCGVADTDTDVDGTADCSDLCPADAAKIAPGICGCSVADTDTDTDGTSDCIDLCPTDVAKILPGICGCGLIDADLDGDTVADCNDGCPGDPGKVNSGVCGCGVTDTDADGDGTAHCNDTCDNDPAKTNPGICGCGIADTDSDVDGTADCEDGCVDDPAKTEAGICGCGVADTDTDADGTADCNDGCPEDPDKVELGACGCGVADTDTDSDGVSDCNDLCPADPGKSNPGSCGCGAADTDSDMDGTADCEDQCLDDPAKTEPGICGCGHSDNDGNENGLPDCQDDRGMKLELTESTIRFKSSDAKWAMFSGKVELLDGNMSTDFRMEDLATGSVDVTVGDEGPVIVYSNDEIDFEVRDNNPNDNREKWQYRSQAKERVTFRWKNSMKYDAKYDLSLPDDVGRLRTRFIHSEETRFRFKFKNAQKPLTVAVDGIHLLSVDEDGNVTSALPHWVRGKRVDVLYPDRLVPGNLVQWYRDSDPSDGYDSLVYEHDAIEDDTAESTYFNAGGRFHIKVPVTAAIDDAFAEQTARVVVRVGEQGVSQTAEASFVVPCYLTDDRHWIYREDEGEATCVP